MQLEAENYLGCIKRVYTPITEDAKLHYTPGVQWISVSSTFVLERLRRIKRNQHNRGGHSGVEGAQLEWVKSDLEKVDRSVAPRIVVIRHNRYYNTWRAHQCQ
ncbi:hypothetical protein L917_19660 [Phytophthora nicotianae]|uniref:Uncharacterized protein n=1 Tax=Phytophthora nicotianae TaxID=4792 RepID=W2K3L9_PHYNI|nr:hypothetical protein L917_19660 [Phytophthora nicotianae]